MTTQTETPQHAAPEPPRRMYHFAMTLQYSSGGRMVMNHGTVGAAPGTRRQDLFKWVYETVKERAQAPDDAVVVFASIEPDELELGPHAGG
jgi:hypothetical protein